MKIGDLNVGDILELKQVHRETAVYGRELKYEDVIEYRTCIVTAVDKNTESFNYAPHSINGSLDSGYGSFSIRNIGQRYGTVSIRKIGTGIVNPPIWQPKPGNIHYDLMC